MSAPRIAEIQRAVAEHFGLRVPDLICDRRGRSIMRPRQAAMYLARELTAQTWQQIGRAFRRDHTTVMYGCEVVAKLIAAGDPIANHLAVLRVRIMGDPAQGVLRIVA